MTDLPAEPALPALLEPPSLQSTWSVLAFDPDPLVRAAVASHRGAPLSVLHGFKDDPDELVRCAVAGNPESPPVVLAWLARDGSADVRVALSRNPALPEDVMAMLAWDSHPSIAYWLARHPEASDEILNLLALHELEAVQVAVALNLKAPTEACLHLAKVGHPAARHALHSRPRLPEIVRRRLLQPRVLWDSYIA